MTNPMTQLVRLHLAELAAGLTLLDEWLDANPELDVVPAAGAPGIFYVFCDTPEAFADAVRRLAHGAGKAEVTKSVGDTWANAVREFGAITLNVTARRDDVCERVVVGHEVVVAPNPAAVEALPKERQEVPVYEWRCAPFLAATQEA